MTQENLKNEFEFINQFKQLHDKEKANLPYHINLIDELHADENAHSRILAKLLQYKSAEQKYDILDSFVEYLKEIGNRQDVDFNKIKIDNPEISQEKERIDLWIKEKNKYAIILENKVKSAGDQQAQIDRYIDKTIRYGEFKEEQIYVIYLPLTYEKELEQQSLGKYSDSNIYHNRFLVLSFKDDILFWLKEIVLPNVKKKDVYLNCALEQYVDHLETISGLCTRNDKMNMELQKFVEEKLQIMGQDWQQKIKMLSKEDIEQVLQISEQNLQQKIQAFSQEEKDIEMVIEQISKIKENYNKQNLQQKKQILSQKEEELNLLLKRIREIKGIYNKNAIEEQKVIITKLLDKIKSKTENETWQEWAGCMYLTMESSPHVCDKITIETKFSIVDDNPFGKLNITITAGNTFVIRLKEKYSDALDGADRRKYDFKFTSDEIENWNEDVIIERLKYHYDNLVEVKNAFDMQTKSIKNLLYYIQSETQDYKWKDYRPEGGRIFLFKNFDPKKTEFSICLEYEYTQNSNRYPLGKCIITTEWKENKLSEHYDEKLKNKGYNYPIELADRGTIIREIDKIENGTEDEILAKLKYHYDNLKNIVNDLSENQ